MKTQIFHVMYLGSSFIHGGIYDFQTSAKNEKEAIKKLFASGINKKCIEKVIKVYQF
jgi:hypothetical protein